jgi:hypothetical protein
MASLSDRIRAFLRSPKGQQLSQKAHDQLRKPENKRRLRQLMQKHSRRR